MPHGRQGIAVAESRNISIRCPLELVRAVESLLEKRRMENPYQLPSIGDVYRELLARGLEAVATEKTDR